MRYLRIARLLLAVALVGIALTGCATNSSIQPIAAVPGMSGAIHGGQQPISGATIQLYTVGTSGDGSAATTLLTVPVTSDASGNFNITRLYTCPSASALVYLTATGGSPGSSINNPQIALMAALGPCGSLTSSTFINVNEITTVAAVYALAPYMTSFSAVGSGTSDAAALAQRFAFSGYVANTSTGTTPGPNLPANDSLSIAQVNTIADLLAACINSPGGVSGDTSICGQFFALSLPSGATPPTDAIGALLNLANNPTLNTAALYNLIPSSGPFQPTQPVVPPNFALNLIVPSAFTVSPSSLVFAPSALYYATQPNQTITVTNGTAAPVSLDNVITGVNASDFGVPVNTCGSTLAANSTCTYQISFVPSASGVRAAYFVLGNSSANPSIAIALSGTGIPGPALVTLTPSSATFPTTNVGSSSTMTFTLTNLSTNTYYAFSGTGNPAFTQTNNCPGAYVLPAGGSCTITVTFSPSAAGPQSDTLTVKYDNNTSYTSGTLSAPLTGVGTAPGLQFSSLSLQFPATAIGSVAPTQTVALYNYGTGPASNLTTTFNLAGASSFTETNNCPATLAVNAYCVFTLTAAPTQIGALVSNMVVSTPGSGATLTLLMTGTAGSPTNNPLVLSDTQAYVPSGGSSVITLTNTGSGPIAFASFNTSTGFSQTNTCGITLAAGATCNVQLSAASVPGPTAVTGILTISSNAATLVETVSLYTAPSVFDFGSVVVGYPSTSLFADTCGAYCNVNPTTAGPDPGDFPFSGPGSCGGRVGCTVDTQFVPTAVGRRIATSTYNGYTTLLIGTGIPATGQVTSFSISAASINFGTFYVGYSSPQPVTLTLTNTGNQPVPINSIYTTSSCFSCYSFPQTNTCASSLAVGSTCDITVSYSNFLGSGYALGNLIILTYSLTPSIVVPLSIDLIYPQLNFSFSSTNVTLVQAQAGTQSTAQSVTLSNTGNIPLIVATGPYASGGTSFSYTTTCGTVPVGGNCTISVNGTPPSVGTFSGLLPVTLSGAPLFSGSTTQYIGVSVTGY